MICCSINVAAQCRLADLAEQKKWSDLQSQLAADASSINCQQADGMTALHWAVEHGHLQSVDRLAAASADPNVSNRYGVRPLLIACRSGQLGLVKSLLQSKAIKVDAKGPSGESPLMLAARQGNPDIVSALVEAGADVEINDKAGQTALMWAAAQGNTDVVKLLVARGAKLDRRLDSGFNAFMFAVRGGHVDCVQAIVKLGEPIDQTMQAVNNRYHKTSVLPNTSPLLLAIANGHLQLALRLVEWGADPNDQRSGISPLHAVAWLRKPDRGEDVEPPVQISGNLSSLDFVRELVAKGADVNLKIVGGKAAGKAKLNSDGASPLLYAAKTADTALMKVLVDLGADIHCQNADGCTPLLAAAGVGVTAVDEEAGTESEVVEAIEYLLSVGASIQAVTAKKDSAMHGAAFRAYPAVIQLLHQRGLKSEDWNHKDSFGWSPFDIADGKRPGSVKPNPSVRQALENALRSFENQ